jgi:phage terminase large subunit-like protein
MVCTIKPNIEAAERAVFFIEHLRHTKGKQWAGKLFKLMPWQRDIVEALFGTLNPDGTRQYRTCYIELPRKNGKSTLASAIALYLLFADDEPGAQVYSAANDRNQAALVFNDAAAMVRQAPALLKRGKVIDSQKRIVYYAENSFYCAISAEAYSKFGYDSHGVIYDELHAAPNRELWDVLTTSFGARRQPLLLCITTAGYDRNSICWEQHDYACKVRDGIINDPTFLPIIYAAPDDADWTDEKVWFNCNPALDVFRSLEEMRTLCAKAQETPALEMTFRRLYLNQWTSSVERWMPMDRWDECSGAIDEVALKGKSCYAGLDLAATIDLTALSLVFPNDGNYEVIMRFWIPGDTAREKERKDRVPYSLWARQEFIKLTEGNVIDYGYIKQELLDLLDAGYNIRELAFDRWGATKLVQDLVNSGRFTLDPSKEPNKVAIVPFGQGYASMSAPTKELMNLVLGGKIRHGGHPVLRWNADNMVVTQDPAGNLKPDKARATQKIDGCVALVMAIDRASRHKDEEKSVYESRGVTVL